MRHYLDHASTTALRPEGSEAISNWLAEATPADPGRVHTEGRAAREPIETAREHVAHLLGARPREVVFTSGATEAINAAVFGATRARPGAAIVCAGVEHSAVRDASRRAAPIVDLRVDQWGRIDVGHLDEILARPEELALVHCQWANHEVGTIQPVAEVVAHCRQRRVPVHVDAATAAGHVEIGFDALEADLCSVSAHKLGGPSGSGALLVRRFIRFDPLLVGGEQERARRAGLENMLGIVGFGAAAAALCRAGVLGAEETAARRQTAAILAALTAVDGVEVLGDPDNRVPHIVCAAVDGVESEAVLVGLDQAGIAVHSGSACSSESLEPSPVLAAMGVAVDRSLRVSVGWNTTEDDIAAFERAFPEVVANLRALRA